MKAILMSGFFRNEEIPNNIIEFIKENIYDALNISFIASDFDGYEKTDKYANKFIDLFEQKINFNKIHIIDTRLKKDEMINCIKDSNIILILGGDTLKQMSFINKFDLSKYICSDKKIIIGVSAGAINMAKRVVLAKDEDDNIPELSIYNGIGVTNVNIEPHCDFDNKNHWCDLEEASWVNKIYVMDDYGYIIINNDDINFYEGYCVLDKGKIYYKDEEVTFDYFIKPIKCN